LVNNGDTLLVPLIVPSTIFSQEPEKKLCELIDLVVKPSEDLIPLVLSKKPSNELLDSNSLYCDDIGDSKNETEIDDNERLLSIKELTVEFPKLDLESDKFLASEIEIKSTKSVKYSVMRDIDCAIAHISTNSSSDNNEIANCIAARLDHQIQTHVENLPIVSLTGDTVGDMLIVIEESGTNVFTKELFKPNKDPDVLSRVKFLLQNHLHPNPKALEKAKKLNEKRKNVRTKIRQCYRYSAYQWLYSNRTTQDLAYLPILADSSFEQLDGWLRMERALVEFDKMAKPGSPWALAK
jgi:hypothetical protein